MHNGLVLPFVNTPSPYFEENNVSALSNLDFVRQEVDKLLQNKLISQINHKPFCCNPLTVAFKKSNNAKRLVIDLSRHVNLHIQTSPVKLDDLSFISPWLVKNSHIMTFDFANMYHHLLIAAEFRKYLGFAVPQPSGNLSFYVFNVLPFGLNEAVSIVSRLCQPLKSLIRTFGFKFGLYIDDGILVSQCRNHVLPTFNLILSLYQSAGWRINHDKTSTSPSQMIKYLGLLIDSKESRFFVPEDKLTNITQQINNLCVSSHVKARELAGILGQIAFISRACGLICKILTRASQHMLGYYVNSHDWNTVIPISIAMKTEFKLLVSHLPRANGQPIVANPSVHVSVNNPVDFTNDFSYVSDASSDFSYVYDYFNNSFAVLMEFPDGIKKASSGIRELHAIFSFLQCQELTNYKNRKIIWSTDSQNVYYWLRHGSRLPQVQSVLLRIKEMEFTNNFSLNCNWLPRSHPAITLADTGSKVALSTDEWAIDQCSFTRISNLFHCKPNIDVCATIFNSKCTRFISKMPMQGSLGTDFLSQKFNISDQLWCCPPVNLAAKFFLHITFNKLPVTIFVVPVWKKSNYWPIITDGYRFHPQIHQFDVFYPKFSGPTDSIFTKPHKFAMLAVKIKNYCRYTPLKIPFL